MSVPPSAQPSRLVVVRPVALLVDDEASIRAVLELGIKEHLTWRPPVPPPRRKS